MASIPLSDRSDPEIGGSGWKGCLSVSGVRLLVAGLESCLVPAGIKS